MKQTTTNREFKTSAAACAHYIKEGLKKRWPYIKFSVTSSTFSMGNSVSIDWEDGPTSKEVEEFTGQFQYGHFDGMNDIYENTNSREDIPQAKYVHTGRKKSEKVKELIPLLAEYLKGYNSSDWHDQPDQILYRLFSKTSFPEGATIKGIERSNETCGRIEDFYLITFDLPETIETPAYKKQEVKLGEIQIIDYSEKAIAVIGDTRPIKDKLGKEGLRGIFQPRLSCGAGWIFPKSRLEEVTKALQTA